MKLTEKIIYKAIVNLLLLINDDMTLWERKILISILVRLADTHWLLSEEK